MISSKAPIHDQRVSVAMLGMKKDFRDTAYCLEP